MIDQNILISLTAILVFPIGVVYGWMLRKRVKENKIFS